MKHHWIVRHHDATVTIYELVDYVPSKQSSREPAEYLEGCTPSQARHILLQMYDRVSRVSPESKLMFCYR